jgi:hypothetical protein
MVACLKGAPMAAKAASPVMARTSVGELRAETS